MNLAESALFSSGPLRDYGRRRPYWKRCMVVVGRGFWVRNFPSVRCCCGRRGSSLPLGPGKFRSKRGRMDDPESEGTVLSLANHLLICAFLFGPGGGLFCPWVCVGDLGMFCRWSARDLEAVLPFGLPRSLGLFCPWATRDPGLF